jgi:hypothetical protein
MHKITAKQLKQIIKEEIQNLTEEHDASDITAGSKVMKSAADLIRAINSFKESSSESAKSHVGIASLDELASKLDNVAKNAMSYIDVSSKPNPAAKSVIFKPSAK